MSGDNWEIKWVLRAMVPSVVVGSNLVYFCRASLTWLEIMPGFHKVFELFSQSLSKMMFYGLYALPFEDLQ